MLPPVTAFRRPIAAICVSLLVLVFCAEGHDQHSQLREVKPSPRVIELETPGSGPDSDLRVFATWIGDARVVQLGELGHGDGTSFVERTRLVRFLHDQLGFNVLAFESGFFEGGDVAEALESEHPIAEALSLGVYPIWALSEQMQPLFEYVREAASSDKPLAFWGFDAQSSSANSGHRFVTGLAQELGQQGHPLNTNDLHQLELLTQAANLSTRVDLDAEAHQQNLKIVEKVKQILGSQSTPSRWSRSLENVAAMEQSLYLRQDAPGFNPADPDATLRHPSVIEGGNLRDRAMAESLLWILGSDPKAKIVVWAANTHVAYRYLEESIAIDGETVLRKPAGQYIREALDIDVFTVLTVTYEGRWAAPSIEREGEWLWTSGEYPPAREGSLAFQLAEQGFEHALVDIREDPNQYTDRHSLFGSDPVDFSTFCDAILFIRTMQPSVKISEDSSTPG